jgi:hypothetical protein
MIDGAAPRWHTAPSPGGWKGATAIDAGKAQNDAARARFGRRAQARLPLEVRKQFLDAIYAGKAFKTAIRDFGLTSNQVWGLTKTDEVWASALEAALNAMRRDDLQHGRNAAYVAGCVCSECREHQRVRMGRNG